MWIDSVIEYDIIVETLTGTEIEVTVTDDDTVGYIKAHIQKYEGIPIRHQHLIFNQRELSDATEVKDVPLSHGSRLKLVVGMKGGPISAQRRLVKMPDLDTWFDLNSVKQDQFTISSPGVKLLVYKDCKKNVQRVKLRTDRKSSSGSSSSSAKNVHDADVDDQFFMDNINTMEKMHQLRTQLELKKRDRISKHFNKSGTKPVDSDEVNGKSMFGKNGDYSKLDEENACGGNDDIGAVGGAIHKLVTAPSKASRKYNRRISLPPLKGFIENAGSVKKPNRSDTKGLVMDSKSLANKHQTQMQKTKTISSESSTSPLMNETPKSKRKITKMNWIQNLIEIMKTSKMPLSPGELNEIKESFQSIRESMGTYRPTSPQAEKSSELKQTPYESMLSNFSKATTISTEPYRPKIRDTIRRSRSFKIGTAEDSVIEENPEQRPKYSLNPVSKSKSGHDFHFNRSMDDLVETSISNRSGSLSSLRSFGASSGASTAPSVDLNCPIESDSNYRLYLRRMTSPKYLSNVVENKLYFKKQNAHQTASNRCEERKAFTNEFHKFKSKSNPTTYSPSAAKAIADSSSFRVYKMATDAKNYELPKLLIREGSPIESFHSSDNQMETLALRCDSPKSVISTPGSTIDISTSVTQTETMPVQLNTVLATTTTDLIEPNALNQSPELDTLLYEHRNGLEISFHDTATEQIKGASLVGNKSNGNDSCELLHNSKPSICQSNEFRTMFGSSPLLNYNSVTTTSRCLDNIPLKHRRGYSNLKDACLSSSTSNIKDILRSNQYTKDSLRSAAKSTTNTNSIGNGNSISQEIFSLLRNHNNAPADYVRSYENLDRTKIIRIKNNSKRIIGNTNYGYHDGDTTTSYSKYDPHSSNNMSQNWRYGKSFDDEMKEEDDSTNYSYSNLAYESSDIGGPATSLWNTNQDKSFQSDDSLFNINFDTVDDDVFHVDSMNFLDVNDCPRSEQNTFESATMNTREMNKQSNNHQAKKCDASLSCNYGLSTAGISNLMGPSDRNALGFERSIIKFGTKPTEPMRSNRLEVNPMAGLNQSQSDAVKSTIIRAPILSSSGATAKEPDNKPSKNPRCAQCNKKLGIIMVMKCHCEEVFCSKHRYAEAHNCSYDFKKEGQKTIAKENPLVVASKVTKI